MKTFLALIFLILLVSEISGKPNKRKFKRELFEGDMRLTREQQDMAYSHEKNDKKSFIVKHYLWEKTQTVDDDTVVNIPFKFGPGASNNLKNTVKEVVGIFHRLTCIKFKEHNGESDYLLVKGNTPSCDAAVGHIGGEQIVNLGSGCQSKGHVIHELMHSLGFYHEQARPDRDNYVEVLYENIQEGAVEQFDKYSYGEGITGSDLIKYPYDTQSIMHYESNAFSKNGQPTIQDKKSPGKKVGQLKYFSTLDLFKINSIYCPEYLDRKTYEISIETSNDWWSGTDAKVFLEMYGEDGANSGEIEMKGGKFEAGDIDDETFVLPDLTPIKKACMWHSNEGYGASWKELKITITDKNTGEKFGRVVDEWLEGDASENKMCVEF